MKQIIQLMEDYLADQIDAEPFIIQYISLVREIRDMLWDVTEKNPKITNKLEHLLSKRERGKISDERHKTEWDKLVQQLDDIPVYPYSKEEQAMMHLFVEADAYRDDPTERIKNLHIDEDELKTVVRQTLDILKG